MKYFVLLITYSSGKKGAYPTDTPDLATALVEFKSLQMKAMNDITEDKSYSNFPEIVSAEIVRTILF